MSQLEHEVVQWRKRAKLFGCLRDHRHALFDATFQQELAGRYPLATQRPAAGAASAALGMVTILSTVAIMGGAMRWTDLEAAQSRLAALGRRKLVEPGVVLVATIRRDGSPRLSPVEPLLWEGDLWLSMGWGSCKAGDLLRDPRILVHSIVTSRDGTEGEYKLRGRVSPETDPGTQARYARAVAERLGWSPEVGKFHLFRVDIDDITFIHWDDATNDQYVTRWPEQVEFVRRGTSATSQGPAELTSDLLD